MRKESNSRHNNSRNVFLLLLVIGVVAVSGCISGGTTSSTMGNGILINEFASSVSEASDCDKSVRVNLDIENNGGKSISINELLACLSGKNFPGITKEQMWAIDSTQSGKVCQSLAKKLDAPDTVKNIPGGAASFKWTVSSPYVPFPLTRTDGFEGRVFYKYASRTSATIFVISESELAVAKQTGKALPSVPEIEKTSSPVDISVDVSQPVIGDSGDTFTLKVTLSNVGGGTVFDPSAISFSDASSVPSIMEDKLNMITIKVDTSLNAGGDSEGGFCNADLKNVELRRGSTVTIPCDIKINRQITKLQSFPILLTASYGYFIDSNEVPITVSGKKSKDALSCVKGTSSSDTTAPTISGKSPEGSTVAKDANVVVTFSEAMDQSATQSATTLVKKSDSSSVAVAYSWSSDGKVLTLNPASDLAASTEYKATVSTGAHDIAGNALVAGDANTWSFTTSS